MSKLIVNCTNLFVQGQLKSDDDIDRLIGEVVEAKFSEQILALENELAAYPEAFAIYQKLDLLLAAEKGALIELLRSYLTGLSLFTQS